MALLGSHSVEPQTLTALPAVLALEPARGAKLPRLTLDRQQTIELATFIAMDLAALVPQLAQTQLVVSGALFDAVELLRPGFPIWAALTELARHVAHTPAQHIIAFGSNGERMPTPLLEPDPHYADGPMRLLPLSLLIPPALATAFTDIWEVVFVDRGQAGERTADWLIRTLNVPLEHARYLSRNDLLAFTCVQYEHANLAPLWTLLEAAMLTPYREETALSAHGLGLRYAAGTIYLQSPVAWLDTQHTDTLAQRAHALAGMMFELRQYAALLQAHGLSLRLAGERHAAMGDCFIEWIADAALALDAAEWFAHEASGLGVIAITVAQRSDKQIRVLAHGYPLTPHALTPLLSELAKRYRCTAKPHRLGRILLSEDGKLSAPAKTLH